MPTSGLVVTLTADQDQQQALTREIACWEGISLGELAGVHLPVVAETATEADHEALLRRLETAEGVLHLRLAFYDFADVTDFDSVPRRLRRRGPQGGSRCNDGNS